MKKAVLIIIALVLGCSSLWAISKMVFIEPDHSYYEPDSGSEIIQSFQAGDTIESVYRLEKHQDRLWIRITPSDEYIPAEHVLLNAVQIGSLFIGAHHWIDLSVDYELDYFQVNSHLLRFDGSTKSRSIVLPELDPTDRKRVSVADDQYIVVQHNYNHFTTSPVGYEGFYYFLLHDTDLSRPVFHYYNQIGCQDRPYLSLKNRIDTENSVSLEYEYYESIGFPDAGHGTLTLIYHKTAEGFTLDRVESAVRIDPSFYDQWPYKKWRISNEVYTGDGWYPEGAFHSIGLDHLNSKFRYFSSAPKILFGAEALFSQTGRVTHDHVRVRRFPALDGRIEGKVHSNEPVHILDRSSLKMRIGEFYDYWYLIETENGLKGWAYGAFIDQ